MCNIVYSHYTSLQNSFTALKIACVQPIDPSPSFPSLQTPWNHWSFNYIYNFTFSGMLCGVGIVQYVNFQTGFFHLAKCI